MMHRCADISIVVNILHIFHSSETGMTCIVIRVYIYLKFSNKYVSYHTVGLYEFRCYYVCNVLGVLSSCRIPVFARK
jgi:hypothetical protein